MSGIINEMRRSDPAERMYMQGSSKVYAVLLCTILLSAVPLWAQDSIAKLSVHGDIQKPVGWSIDELKTRFAEKTQEVNFTTGKEKQSRVGTGIPLLSIIQAAGLKTDKAIRHHDMKFMVVVEAHDRYRAFFSVAELLPDVGRGQAFLVWAVDGKPLSGNEAPLRLVVTTDPATHRQIFGVVKLILLDGNRLADEIK